MNQPNEFGSYLRRLRETREMTARQVERKLVEMFPNDKQHHISQAHLTQIETGFRPAPNPLKLKGISKLYGENYEFILYKAGYLDRNPFKAQPTKDLKAHRDKYFEELARTLKRRALNDTEKEALEEAVKKMLIAISPEVK